VPCAVSLPPTVGHFSASPAPRAIGTTALVLWNRL
jgi:hypothetical protein